ncbi:hypothetical protein FACS189459_6460 [Bacilli bacterium]|nr:hypothetical protein FACS189459_6460 [Bacilli bacterium]
MCATRAISNTDKEFNTKISYILNDQTNIKLSEKQKNTLFQRFYEYDGLF